MSRDDDAPLDRVEQSLANAMISALFRRRRARLEQLRQYELAARDMQLHVVRTRLSAARGGRAA